MDNLKCSGWMAAVTILLGLLFIVGGCATTGRGEFPTFQEHSPESHELMVLPPVGIASDQLRTSILSHVHHPSLRQRFKNVYLERNPRVGNLLANHFSGERISNQVQQAIQSEVDSNWVLAFYVHEFAIKEFSKTETKTLFRTESSHHNTSVFTDDSGNGNGSSDEFITSHEREFTSQEIPITTGQIRVVLSLSAMVYDVDEGRVIWRGRRIERAQDELADLSSIELKDIVVERVMYRITSRLTA